jgi:beta-alanine degradation protein BauB
MRVDSRPEEDPVINLKAVVTTVVLAGVATGCKEEAKPQDDKSAGVKEVVEKPADTQAKQPDTGADPTAEVDTAAYVDPIDAAPDNYESLAEGDFARVLRAGFKPGAKTNPHSHPASFIYALTDIEGQSHYKGKSEALKLAKGEAKVLNETKTYNYEHVGKEKGSFLVFEIEPSQVDATRAADAAPSLPEVAPNSAKVLAETKEARLILSEIKPGEEQKSFSYGPHATYILSGGTLKAWIPGLKPQQVKLKEGAANVEPAIPNLTVKNVSKGDIRILVLELKPKS